MFLTRLSPRLSINFVGRTRNSKLLKMSALDKILANNKLAEEKLESLKREFTTIKNDLIASKIKEITQENEVLRKQIEVAKQQLIQIEISNGKKQIPVPGQSENAEIPQQVVKPEEKPTTPEEKKDDKKEKQSKKEKPKKAPAPEKPTIEEAPIDVGRLDMRIGKIVEVDRHPDADSLYLEKIDVGEANPRTVVSGLVKHVPIEEMRNRMVIVLCNLKPAKMRGVLSEAMVMCASSAEKVEIMSPPPNAVPGDLVHCEGFTRNPDPVMNPKKKIFETVAPDLLTNENLVGCYKGQPLYVPDKGNIFAQTLKNVNIK